MTRCGNVSHCDNIVNTRGSHVRIGERLFCSNDCALEHAHAERVLARAAAPFKDYVSSKVEQWHQNTTAPPLKPPILFGDDEGTGDCA